MSAVMRKWKQVPVNWHDITVEAQQGRLTQFLEERDEITYIGKDGIAQTVVAAKVTDTGALFIAKDLPARRPMYNCLPGKLLSWAESDDRKIMNTEDLALLPDDLVAEITPRRIVQLIGGEEVVTEDKLWRPSETEMFGRGEWGTECDGPDEEQLPIFKTEADRVKNFNGETWWYATRSPLSSSSTNFCHVNLNGTATNTNATGSIGVAFGFLIGSMI